MSAFIVAECGVNFDGDRRRIPQFIDAAKRAGASATKWQAFDKDKLIARRGITDEKTICLLEKCELTDRDLDMIAAHSKAVGLPWFASVFDPSQVERVLSRGACALKIGHKEADWEELVSVCQKTDSYTWISNPPPWAMGLRTSAVLCVVEYPAISHPSRWSEIRDFDWYRGVSSHYADYRIPAAAALRGAEYIEAHFRLSDSDPEAAWSLSEEDFGKMVKLAREYESWL